MPAAAALRFALATLALAACSGGTSGQTPALPGVELASVASRAPSGGPLSRKSHDASASGFSALRAVFSFSYVCDNGVLIAKYLKAYGIATVFVPVAGDDLATLLAGNPTTVKNLSAMLDVANVYVVSGQDAWVQSPSSVPSDVTSLVAVAAKFPRLSGILYAIDPETLPAWKTQRQATVADYFTLVGTLENAPGASNFKKTLFTTDLNFATIASGKAGSSMLQRLQSFPGTTGVTTIVPGNSASEQFSEIQSSLAQYVKPFRIEASATQSRSGQSYYGVTPSYLATNLTQLQQRVAAKNPLLASIEVNGWSDLFNSLSSVLPQPPTFNGTLASGPLVPPAGSAYLGAYVDPSGQGQSPSQTAQFEGQIGRKLAFNMHFYFDWTAPFPGSQEADDINNGRIPVEAWNCGDTDANVASGKDDALLRTRAQALKAFGYPIFVRWFWEMNLTDNANPPRTQCWDPNTDLPGGFFSPAEFIAAWTHVRAIFAQVGANNVIWEWNVAAARGGTGQYYPGDSQVDWIAMDDYDRQNVSFQSTMYYLAASLSQFQEKPLMINETGAYSANQPAFLNGAAQTLQSDFPAVRAIGYFDSIGTFHDWVLSPQGLTAFAGFANQSYMNAIPQNP